MTPAVRPNTVRDSGQMPSCPDPRIRGSQQPLWPGGSDSRRDPTDPEAIGLGDPPSRRSPILTHEYHHFTTLAIRPRIPDGIGASHQCHAPSEEPSFDQAPPDVEPRASVHREDGDRRAASRNPAEDQGLSKEEMIGPRLAPWMEQGDDRAGVGVDAGQVGALVEVAMLAGQGEIGVVVGPAVLARDDVLGVMPCLGMGLGKPAVFAPVVGPGPDVWRVGSSIAVGPGSGGACATRDRRA